MCFSATASFTASGFLTIIGLLSISKARNPLMQFFAATPLLFAMQQAAEGIVWTADPTSLMHRLAVFCFLSFAFLVWPLWMSSIIRMAETDVEKKKILTYCVVAGILFDLYAIARVLAQGIHVHVTDHIRYVVGSQETTFIVPMVLYLIATVVPFFISSRKHMQIVGSAIAVSYCATMYWYAHYFVSIWCFSAALLSALVLWIVIDDQRTQNI